VQCGVPIEFLPVDREFLRHHIFDYLGAWRSKHFQNPDPIVMAHAEGSSYLSPNIARNLRGLGTGREPQSQASQTGSGSQPYPVPLDESDV
jgi:hypothetical protein